jgi:hypothetical protein
MRHQQRLQFAERHVRLLGDRGPQQRPLGVLQERLGTPTVPRRKVLSGPMQAEHLFDERQTDTKHTRDVHNRQFPLFDGGHHAAAELFRIGSHNEHNT